MTNLLALGVTAMVAISGSASSQMVATTTTAPLFSYMTVTNVNYRAQELALGRVVIEGKCLVLHSNNGLLNAPVVFDRGVHMTRKSVKLTNGKVVTFDRNLDKVEVGLSVFPARLFDGLTGPCFKLGRDVALLY